MLNSRLFQNKTPNFIQDIGVYDAHGERDFMEILEANKTREASKAKAAFNNQKNNIKCSKEKIMDYILILDEISNYEDKLSDLYNRKAEMESELLNDSTTKRILEELSKVEKNQRKYR